MYFEFLTLHRYFIKLKQPFYYQSHKTIDHLLRFSSKYRYSHTIDPINSSIIDQTLASLPTNSYFLVQVSSPPWSPASEIVSKQSPASLSLSPVQDQKSPIYLSLSLWKSSATVNENKNCSARSPPQLTSNLPTTPVLHFSADRGCSCELAPAPLYL